MPEDASKPRARSDTDPEASPPTRERLFSADSNGTAPSAVGDPPSPQHGDSDDDREFLKQEFLDALHGFVRYTERELRIIDHPAFQRLFFVNQLGHTNLVFRGATHRRGDHALGSVATAEQLISSLDYAYQRAQTEAQPDDAEWQVGKGLSALEITFLRLAVLLHDIGHIAAGHTLEDELGLLPEHDSRERLEFILTRKTWGGLEFDSDIPAHDHLRLNESLRDRVNRLYDEDLKSANIRADLADNEPKPEDSSTPTATDILLQLVGKDPHPRCTYRSRNPSNSANRFRVDVLKELVGDTVCADLLDYLERDSRYLGKNRRIETRLLQYIEVHNSRFTDESHVVVNLRVGDESNHRTDAVSAVIGLLDNRYDLWESALLHKTKNAATAMLERAIAERLAEVGMLSVEEADKILESILELSDLELITTWPSSVLSHQPLKQGRRDSNDRITPDLFWRLRYRFLHKQVIRVGYGAWVPRISKIYTPDPTVNDTQSNRFNAAEKRLYAIRLLERDFELGAGSLAMHIVPQGLGKKWAEVRVLYGGESLQLKDMDTTTHGRLSAGGLQVQLDRFDALWSAALFAAPEVVEDLEERALIELLRKTFKSQVLGIEIGEDQLVLAQHMVDNGQLQYTNGARVVDAAVAQRSNPSLEYPSRRRTIRSLIQGS